MATEPKFEALQPLSTDASWSKSLLSPLGRSSSSMFSPDTVHGICSTAPASVEGVSMTQWGRELHKPTAMHRLSESMNFCWLLWVIQSLVLCPPYTVPSDRNLRIMASVVLLVKSIKNIHVVWKFQNPLPLSRSLSVFLVNFGNHAIAWTPLPNCQISIPQENHHRSSGIIARNLEKTPKGLGSFCTQVFIYEKTNHVVVVAFYSFGAYGRTPAAS